MDNKTLEEFSLVIIGLMFTLMTVAFGFEGFFEMAILFIVPIIICIGKEILKIGVSILFSKQLLIIGILCFLIYLLFKYNITVVTTLIILGIGSLKVNGINTYFLIRNLLYKNIK